MAKARGDFTDVLIKRKVLSHDQLEEAFSLANSTGVKIQDALAKLNYASLVESTQAMAEHSGLQFVDLSTIEIPKSVIEQVPESVARENIDSPKKARPMATP